MVLVSFVFIFLLMISCRKDNEGWSLIGEWQLQAYYDGNTATGGCNCWVKASGINKHSVEFRSNGTYQLFPGPTLAYVIGCSNNYELRNDTLRWRMCRSADFDAVVSYSYPFLMIEERTLGGVYAWRYKRVN